MMDDSTTTPSPRNSRQRKARRAAVVGALILAPLVGFGIYWFQPQKLVIDDKVSESLPPEFADPAAPTSIAAATGRVVPATEPTSEAATEPASGPAEEPTSAPAGASPSTTLPAPEPSTTVPSTTVVGPIEIGRGEFRSLEHDTSGTAVAYDSGNGSRLLRLEDLDTSNGPDLRVILSSAPISDDWKVWGSDYIELDRLKGNVGSQNYEIPADVDLSRYGRVVIWCIRFEVGFGVADLAVA